MCLACIDNRTYCRRGNMFDGPWNMLCGPQDTLESIRLVYMYPHILKRDALRGFRPHLHWTFTAVICICPLQLSLNWSFAFFIRVYLLVVSCSRHVHLLFATFALICYSQLSFAPVICSFHFQLCWHSTSEELIGARNSQHLLASAISNPSFGSAILGCRGRTTVFIGGHDLRSTVYLKM